MGPKSNDWCLFEEEIWRDSHTEGRWSCEDKDRGRVWSDVAISQGMTRVTDNY